jgi:WD40 repeat protein
MAIKQLTLLGSTVKRIADSDGLLFHFTEGGVDVHNMLGQRQAYASLANVTCGAVNSNGVYLGTSTGGVYKLTHAAVASGGDQTSALTQAITTATTPAIASNTVAGMDGAGTALIVSTAAGVDFLPDAATVYSYTDANGCGACTINATEIAYVLASGDVHRLNHPTENWSSGDATVYTAAESVTTLDYEGVPDVTHDYSYGVFWTPNGSYLLFCNADGNTALWLYSFSAGTLTKLSEHDTASFANGNGGISINGDYIAVGCYSSPYLTWYTMAGSTITKRTDPSALPAVGKYPAWCPSDDQYLAVCHYVGDGTSGLSFLKRNGTTALDTLTTPDDPGGNGYICAWNGNYLAVGHAASPYITMYRRDGDTLTKLTGVGFAHTGACSALAWHGNYLAAAQSGTYRLIVYAWDPVTETVTELTGLDQDLPSYIGFVDWHNSGSFLAVSINASPWLYLYEFDGDALTLVTSTDGGGVLVEHAYKGAWNGDYLAVTQSTTPSGEGIRLFSLGEKGGGDLLAPAACLALGTDLFIGSDNGIDVLGSSTRAIASPDGKPVKAVAPTPTATTATGILAYGTSDGEDGGQFGAIDLSA